MGKVLIIGGGLSGLGCATFLANNGIDLHLIEASPKLGGRAYSFQDSNSTDIIDNGQHIMMGCYDATLEMISIIGATDKIEMQENLRVVFVDRNGDEHKLQTTSTLYPLNLSKAILSYTALTIKERFRVLDLFLDLICTEENDLIDTPVLQWLKNEHQDDVAISSLWEILAIGTLNSNINEASAAVFVNILKQMFLGGNDASKIVLPKVGLSDLFCVPAAKYISQKSSIISLSEKVTDFKINNNRIESVVTSNGRYDKFDYVVSALPIYSSEKIIGFPDISTISNNFSYSPIVSVNIWLSENNFKEKFYGLIDSPIHWIFNHGNYLTLVTSAADDLMDKTDEEIKDSFSIELSNIFSVFSRDLILSYKIIREKRATFIPTAESIQSRNKFHNSIENLIVCGDWTEPLLPATIETAVLSGKKAAEKILQKGI